jgi:biotin carboxyl carrier protein
MKLKAQLADSEHHIALEGDGNLLQAEVDGREHEVRVNELGDGNYLLTEGARIYHCRVEPEPGRPRRFEVYLRGTSYEIGIVDPKRLRSGQGADEHGHGAAEIVAPMPGKVVRVLVDVGTRVEAGIGIAVVEAMKMQNEMKSPKAGTVVSLNVEAGATVNAGDVLAVIE